MSRKELGIMLKEKKYFYLTTEDDGTKKFLDDRRNHFWILQIIPGLGHYHRRRIFVKGKKKHIMSRKKELELGTLCRDDII